MSVYYSEDEVAKGANTLGGCAGPTEVDGLMLRGWVLQKDLPSEIPRAKRKVGDVAQ